MGCGGAAIDPSARDVPDDYRPELELPLEGREMREPNEACDGLTVAEARAAATHRRPGIYAFSVDAPAPGGTQLVWGELQQDMRTASCHEGRVVLRGMFRLVGYDRISILATDHLDLRLPAYVTCSRHHGNGVVCDAHGVGSERYLAGGHEVAGQRPPQGTFDLFARTGDFVDLKWMDLRSATPDHLVPMAKWCGEAATPHACPAR